MQVELEQAPSTVTGLRRATTATRRLPPRPLPLREDLPLFVASLEATAVAELFQRWGLAHPALDVWLREGASRSGALRRLALTLWSRGDADGASRMLTAAAALAPDDAAIWLDLGYVLQAVGDRFHALQACERAATLDPGSARARLAVGLLARETNANSRAETALCEALALDPGLCEAAFALGLLCFDQRRYAEAASHWRQARAVGSTQPMLIAGLGQCLFFLGDFSGAAEALGAHLALGEAEPAIVRRCALAHFLDAAIRSTPEAASSAYQGIAGAHGEPLRDVARAAFSLLGGYGYAETALRVADAFLRDERDDPVHRYHLAAISGADVTRAPVDYVSAYFDRFADKFETQLVDVLQYNVPEKLDALIRTTGAATSRTLDLGCGTGLASPRLRSRSERLVGVDLSPRMLAKARERGLYDELVAADMIAWLEATDQGFDLIFAADSLIYFGPLEPLLAAAARALAPGGLLALSIETTSRAAWELLPSGRFAHAPKALLATAAPWFNRKASRRAFLRIEAHRRVYGALMVLERRGSSSVKLSSA